MTRNVIKGEEPRIYDDINGQFSFIEVQENEEEFEVIRNLYFEQLQTIIGSEDKEANSDFITSKNQRIRNCKFEYKHSTNTS